MPKKSIVLTLSFLFLFMVGSVYFPLASALASGETSRQLEPTLQGTPPGYGLSPTPVTPVVPVTIATPGADGSIIHVVQYGQTLSVIANVYKVSIDQIKALNKLTSDTIYEGEKLIIQPASTATPVGQSTAAVATSTTVPRPTRTSRPTRVPASPTTFLTATPVPTPTPTPTLLSGLVKDPLLLSIIVIAAIGFLMMIAGSLLKRNPSG